MLISFETAYNKGFAKRYFLLNLHNKSIQYYAIRENFNHKLDYIF